MVAYAGDHLGDLPCDGVGCSSSQAAGDVAAAAAAIGSVPDRESSESVGEPFAQLAVKEHGRSELKEHEAPESRRKGGALSLFARGPLPSTQEVRELYTFLAESGHLCRLCLLPQVPLELQESFAGRVFLAEIAAVPGWVPRSLAAS